MFKVMWEGRETAVSFSVLSIRPAIGNRNSPYVACLAHHVNDGPMFLSPLKVVHLQPEDLVPAQAAGKLQTKHCPVPFPDQLIRIGGLPERLALFDGQPVSQAYPQVPGPFDAANAGGEIGAEQATISRLVCQPSIAPMRRLIVPGPIAATPGSFCNPSPRFG